MDYGGINAKVKAMYSRLMTYDDFESLSRLKTPEELSQRIKEHPSYEEVIKDVSINERRRSIIQRKMLLSLAKDLSKIYGFVTNYNLRQFLDGFYLKNEVYILKMLVSLVYDTREIVYTNDEMNLLLGNKNKIDVQKLKTAKNLYDFIEGLNNTTFYTPLSTVYSEKHSLFELETQLDLIYYTGLWKSVGKLDKENKKVMTKLVGAEVDMKNIAWIKRLKTYYHFSDSLVYAYLIPHNYKLSKAAINRMVETKSLEELDAEIEAGPYGNTFKHNVKPEKAFITNMNKILIPVKHSGTNSMGLVVSYLYYKEQEINNIITLMECLRYGIQSSDAMKHITMADETEVGIV